MPDPAEQLARIYQAGFDIEQFERFPQAVGVVREGCIALLESTPNGLRMIGASGWRMGEVMGVLIEKDGRKVFQSKQEVVEATAELVDRLKIFESELQNLLSSKA
jgi:hypothetical protein